MEGVRKARDTGPSDSLQASTASTITRTAPSPARSWIMIRKALPISVYPRARRGPPLVPILVSMASLSSLPIQLDR